MKKYQPQTEGLLQEEKFQKGSCKNITEEIIHIELFIMKFSSHKYDSETFIVDSSDMSHMVTTEENMTNLRDSKIRVAVGDSGTLAGEKLGDWHGSQKHDRKPIV